MVGGTVRSKASRRLAVAASAGRVPRALTDGDWNERIHAVHALEDRGAEGLPGLRVAAADGDRGSRDPVQRGHYLAGLVIEHDDRTVLAPLCASEHPDNRDRANRERSALLNDLRVVELRHVSERLIVHDHTEALRRREPRDERLRRGARLLPVSTGRDDEDPAVVRERELAHIAGPERRRPVSGLRIETAQQRERDRRRGRTDEPVHASPFRTDTVSILFALKIHVPVDSGQ